MEQNLSITRGDTASFNLQFVDFDGDLANDLESMLFTVKESINGSALFQKSLGSGISAIFDGIYVVRIAPEDTEDLNLGYYYYDLEIRLNSDAFTLLKGVIEITYDVTNPTESVIIDPYAELRDIRVAYDGKVYPTAGDAVRNAIDDIDSDVDVLKSRMDVFTSLEEGSTTGDAELQDIRVGANGTVYPTAGDAVRGQVSDLKGDINYYSISKNLLGTESNILYPCYIPNGSKITISTKDGSTINDNAVILDLWKQDKTRSDFWGMSGYSSRTITVVHDIYYVSIRKTWSVPLQVEKGNTATAFEDWFLSARYLTQELDDINENTKVLSVADRAKLIDELETHYVNGYLDISNGQINNNNDYYTEITNYILVNVGEKYLYSGLCGTSIVGACFYDENFSYISGVGGDAISPVIKEITIPNNSKYVRFASFHGGDTIVSKLLVSRKQDNLIHINNLTHKEWYACGDSYTEGAYVFDGYNPPDKWFETGKYANRLKCYPYYIGNRTNCNVHNIALSGSTLAKVTNDDYSFSYQKYTTIPNTADYITLWFGINDEAQSVPVGNDTDSVNTTFKGAWNVVLAYLLEHCPKAHIGIIVSNSLSRSYVDATIAMAERWGVPYLDLNSDNVPLMQNTLRNVSNDAKAIAISKFAISSSNMHPNYWAHEFESYFIEDFLKRI